VVSAFHKYFVITSLCFGLLYCLIVPPFQVPDEYNHFFRSWQITEGVLIGVKSADKRLGGELPSSLIQVAKPFYNIRYNKNNKTSLDTILVYVKIPLQPDYRQFIDFSNTALYAPTAYIPQSLAILIFRNLKCTPLSILYFARIFNLIFWLSIVYIGIKTTPVFKGLMTYLALLPASLFINATANADVLTNALSFLFIAFMLKYIFKNDRIMGRIWGILILITCLINLNKLAYFPLLLLVFLIKKNNFQNQKQRVLYITTFLIFNLTTLIIWSKISTALHIPFEEYNTEYRIGQQLNEGVEPIRQLNFIIHNPLIYSKILVMSYLKTLPYTFVHYIGKFGWEGNYLPLWIVIPLILMLLLRGYLESPKLNTPFIKRAFWGIGILTSISFATVMYMLWVAVGGDFIHNLGGKYFIPIFPLFFMALPHISTSIKTPHWLPPPQLSNLFWVFSLAYGVYAVLVRYYF
jgi:uncharacterized membrane protein